MLQIISRHLAWILAILTVVAGLCPGPAGADTNLAYNGRWQAEENDEGRLLQNNYQGLTLRAQQQWSEQLEVEESLRYYYSWRERESSAEVVAPGLELRLQNDLFAAHAGALDNRNLKGDSTQATTTTVNSGWNSRWTKDYVPAFRAYYDYSQRQDELEVHVTDETTHLFGGKADWDLKLFQLYYSYADERREDLVALQESSQQGQSAGLRFNRALWDSRIRLSFSQEYTASNFERSARTGAAAIASIPQLLSSVWTGVDPVPTDIDDSMLNLLPAMHDGDLLTAADPLAPPVTNYSVVLAVNSQQVDQIYLYTQTNVGALGFDNWRIYSHTFPGTPWNLVSQGGEIYDPVNRRFVIPVVPAQTQVYLKLVVDLSVLAPPTTFTEIQAVRREIRPPGTILLIESEQETERTNAGLDFQLSRAWLLFYKFGLAREDNEKGELSRDETHQTGLRFANAARDLRSTLSYSLSRRWYKPGIESESSSYLFNLSKQLLPTLTLSGDLTWVELSQEGKKLNTSESYKLYLDAQLYPDLSARVDGRYSVSQQEDEVNPQKRETLNSTTSLTSRLKPSLTLGLGYDYEANLLQGETLEEANRVSLSLAWQASDLLAMHFQAGHTFNLVASDVSNLSANGVLGLTENMELRARYSLVDSADTISQAGELRWRWNLARSLVWETWVNYAEADNVTLANNTKLFCQLSANFSTD